MPISELSSRIASEITNMISAGELAPEAHLNTQKLAERFQVSRSPVREALHLLAGQGILDLHENRGYFVSKKPPKARKSITFAPTEGPAAYYQLAEDWLRDEVPSEFTEQFLRDRYSITKSQTLDILNRATLEGWAERKAGYGWRLLPVAKTSEAIEQIYRLRAVIEPAALLEPTFERDRKVTTTQRERQQRLLDGDIEKVPAIRLVAAGVEFHEEIIKLSRNPFFVQALERVNRLRRLLDYRSMVDRKRYYSQCADHLAILDLVERGDNLEASYQMRRHLSGVLALKSPFLRRSVRG
jgi:DNA-binding GntR family transcriptional regulator